MIGPMLTLIPSLGYAGSNRQILDVRMSMPRRSVIAVPLIAYTTPRVVNVTALPRHARTPAHTVKGHRFPYSAFVIRTEALAACGAAAASTMGVMPASTTVAAMTTKVKWRAMRPRDEEALAQRLDRVTASIIRAEGRLAQLEEQLAVVVAERSVLPSCPDVHEAGRARLRLVQGANPVASR